MRDPIQALANALERDEGGVVVVWCPDFGLRAWFVDEVESLARPEARPLHTTTVEQALAAPDRLALLVPNNEREAVLDLDGSRDRLLGTEDGTPARTQPVVLFLLRDGDGRRALAEEAPSLWSWVAGNDPDPEALAEVDVDTERRAFEQETGQSPEAWLAEWRRESLSPSPKTYRLAYRAMLLERP